MHELTAIVPVSRIGNRLHLLSSWLPEALDLGIHVIIVHDKQDDETGPELKKLTSKLNRKNLSLLEGNFHSPGLARNAGLEITNTTWVTFWDSDDLVYPKNVIEELSLNHNNAEVICCQYIKIVSGIVRKTKETTNRGSLSRNPGIWRLIIRRELIGDVKFKEFPMAEDQVFLWESLVFDSKIHYSKKITYAYSLGDPNQATASKDKINKLNKAIEYLERNKIPKNEKDRRALICRLSLTLIKRGSTKQKLYGIKSLTNRVFGKNLNTGSECD